MAVQFPSEIDVLSDIGGFDWDRGNRTKCQKHGVSLASVEHVFHGPVAIFPDPAHSEMEARFKAIGQTLDGRGVLVVFTLRQRAGATVIRPISARHMHAKELRYYEEAVADAAKRQGS